MDTDPRAARDQLPGAPDPGGGELVTSSPDITFLFRFPAPPSTDCRLSVELDGSETTQNTDVR